MLPAYPDLDVRSEVVTQGHGYPIDRGSTALGIAVRSGRLAAVELLLASGADVDATSNSGNTALLLAVYSDQSPEMVEVLLAAGADTAAVGTCVERCSSPPGDAATWAARLDRSALEPLLRARGEGD
jgi:ankyrin repeat protein